MRVEWDEDALDQLADLYVVATDHARKAVIAATAEWITGRLAEEALFLGQPRGSDYRRAWFHYPLMVMYDVVPGGGVVVNYVVGLRPRRDQE